MIPFPQPYPRLRVTVTFLLLAKEDDVYLFLMSLIHFIRYVD